ncbi:MAG: hypothetical protein QM802_00275 [Agriterribacter sp.]
MTKKITSSSLLIISGIALFFILATACNSGADAEKKADDTTATAKPADTSTAKPALPADTTHMDTASTRPVKGTN